MYGSGIADNIITKLKLTSAETDDSVYSLVHINDNRSTLSCSLIVDLVVRGRVSPIVLSL